MEFDSVDKEFSGHAKVLKRLKDMLVRFNEINKILEDPEILIDEPLEPVASPPASVLTASQVVLS